MTASLRVAARAIQSGMDIDGMTWETSIARYPKLTADQLEAIKNYLGL